MNFLSHEFGLVDHVTRKSIIGAGGKILVCVAGSPKLATLYNPASNFAAMSQPVSAVRGVFRFAVEDTVQAVDVYGVAPGGQSFQILGMKAQELTEYAVDALRYHHMLVIPFHPDDYTDAAEKDTGIGVPAGALVLPNPAVKVTAIDATETIDVGTLSTDSGDADGFLDGVSVATAGLVKGTLANGAITLGQLLWVQDSANAGDEAPEAHVSAGKNVSYTLSTGSDTAEGYILLPYMMPVVGA
jgi:hypothetical protein